METHEVVAKVLMYHGAIIAHSTGVIIHAENEFQKQAKAVADIIVVHHDVQFADHSTPIVPFISTH